MCTAPSLAGTLWGFDLQARFVQRLKVNLISRQSLAESKYYHQQEQSSRLFSI